MPDPMVLTKYAAERARLLLGCYRKGDANDPDTYVAAITATLARYPEDVIRDVTHPATGLPIQKDFLPTVREVYLACEAIDGPRRRRAESDALTRRQLADQAERDRLKPTPEQKLKVQEKLSEFHRTIAAAEIDGSTGERIPPANSEVSAA
jgi:hypothetical protein